MLARMAKYFASVPAVWIDGTLYVCIAMILAIQSFIGTDEAPKYIGDATLFWMRFIVETVGAGAGALKMFRSTSYSDHLAAKKEAAEIEPQKTP